jgi:single-stranded-DNA-specific exonuclease
MLGDSLDLHPITARVLVRRGVTNETTARDYLRPRLAQLLDPAEMADFKRAVSRLADAVERDEQVGVFGDYDVDGITSAAVIAETIEGTGRKPHVRVASRELGYGLTPTDIAAFRDAGCTLVVACDVGSGDHPALEEAIRAGMDVVVLDHHHVPGDPPPAHALVNPGRPGCPFSFHEMASVGVAFYVAAALRTELEQRGWFDAHPEPDIKALLDLVAIGTVADVVSLTGLNRILVHTGLQTINELRRPGLRFLARLAGLHDGPPPIGVKDVAFRLAPRLNAAGRLGDAMPALRLLIEREINPAWRCALELDGRNRQRQRLQEEVYQSAVELVERGGVGEQMLVVAGHHWHPGVVGIVASKLADLYGRPTVVISICDGEGRGSVRTFGGVDVYCCLEHAQAHLVTFGGHASAAGLTVREEQLGALRAALDEATLAQIEAQGGVQNRLAVDAKVTLDEIDDPLVSELAQIQPCGEGNAEPRLLADPVTVVESRLVGNGHLRLRIADATGGPPLEVIGFGMGHLAPDPNAHLRVVFVPEHNTYRGRTSIQLRLLDLGPTEA